MNNGTKTIYIAGPMSGYQDFNRPAFYAAAEILREHGFRVVTPADAYSGDCWEQGMKHDIPVMLSCDLVSLLDGWERSRGARLEVFIARELGIPVETMKETLLSVNGVAEPERVEK